MARFLRMCGLGVLWTLEFIGLIAEYVGRWAVRFARWASPILLEAIGAGAENATRGTWRWARQVTFGNWRRTLATSAVASLALVHYFPGQTGQVIAPLWTIGFALLGIYIMYRGVWLALFPAPPRRRRRQRN